MSPLLPRLLESFNPVGGHLSEREMALRTFRVACAIVATLMVPFGWLHHAGAEGAFDPMGVRWTVTALALALLGATFWSANVQRGALYLNQGCTYALTGYFGWLTYANSLAFGYGVGFLFVFVALAMAHSLTYTRTAPFAVYLGTSTLIALVVAVAVDEPAVPRTVFGLSVTASAAMIFLTVSARLSVMRALAESEAHLAEAQAAAGLGSWEKNFHTGTVRWSAGMFRLTGYGSDTVVPSAEAFLALTHPDDRKRLVDLASIPTGGDTDAMAIRYQRVGSVAWRHADVRRGMVLGANGRPERVFGTIHDTTDVHEREAILQTALGAAEDAAHAKSTFLASMSHEIRTPLTAILGFAQLLSEETGDTHRDLVEPIASAGQRLLATLNSVLDLARMDAGQGDLVLVAVDASAEVRATVALLAGQAAAKGIVVRAEAPAEPLPVLADGAALSRVLTNLASNAVKFTDHGHVTLAVERDATGRRAVFTITDTGRGMDAAFLTELFEPFRQASTGWARSHEGTGLGLTIVKRLVEAMKGTVDVESTPGAGTRFTVALPLAEEVPVPPRQEGAPAEARPAAVTARVPLAA